MSTGWMNKTTRRSRAILLTGSLAAVLAGCGAGTTPAASGHTGPKSGGTVVVAMTPLDQIDWYLPIMPVAYNSVSNGWAQSLQYRSLFTLGSNGLPDFARSIAKKISWNSSGTVYTVTMNPKWHWSNGAPVTAKDVQFDWQLIQAASSKTAPSPWPFVGAGPNSLPTLVKSFHVINQDTFQITVKRPVNQVWFEVDQLSDLRPLPAASWDKYPSSAAQELAYITKNGSNPKFFSVIDGAFHLVSAVSNGSWTFVPNTHYDGHKPLISRLVLQYETTDTAEVSALQTGSVQVGYLPQSSYATRNQLTLDRLVVMKPEAISRTVLDFRNPQVGGILRHRSVREAMQMGIDQTTILKAIDNGLGVQGVGPVPSTSPYYDPALRTPVYPYNIAAGIKLLNAHGWHMVHGVMTNASGQQLSFQVDYPTGSTGTLAMVQLLQQDWAKEGIKVSLNSLPFPTLLQYHQQPTKWEIMTGLSLNMSGVPILNSLYETNGPTNFVHYSNTQLDTLIANALGPQPSTSAAQSALNAYQSFVAHHLPNLWMPVGDSLQEVSKSVHGVVRSVPIPGSFSIYPQYWWVSK